MFREVRRKEKLESGEAAESLLEKGEYGVLSLLGDNDYPYGVPLNYAVVDDCIYAHGATEGHKLDAVAKHPKACFTVVGPAAVLPEEISTRYISVIAFGAASVFLPGDDPEERRKAFAALVQKYVPGDPERTDNYIQAWEQWTAVIKIRIEHMTCKRSND